MKTYIVILAYAFFCVNFCLAQNKATGTFTNLQYFEELGDLYGFEIRIVYTRYGYEGTFQAAEGGPDSLILIKPIIENDTVKFSIPSPSLDEGRFIGKISKEKLVGVLTLKNGNRIELELKRGRSYWD
jgi:hypothetical protein